MNTLTDQLTREVSRWFTRDRTTEPRAVIPIPSLSLPGGAARVRRRHHGDVDAVARILRGISSGGKYPLPRPASHRAWLTEGVVDAWVVERQGAILGHVAIGRAGTGAASSLRWREVTGRPLDDLALVSRFFVRLPERGQGIGTALLAAAVSGARARGLVPVADAVGTSRFGSPLYADHGWRLAAHDTFGGRRDHRLLSLYTLPSAH